MRKITETCRDFVAEALSCDTSDNYDALITEIEIVAGLLERLEVSAAELFHEAGSDGCDTEQCWRVLDRLKPIFSDSANGLSDLWEAAKELESQE